MKIYLIRHGESEFNTGKLDPQEYGDFRIPLSEAGVQQAQQRGDELGQDVLKNSLLYCSPYFRTRQTLDNILVGAGVSNDQVRIYEDPRIREVEFGYYDSEEQQHLRKTHGWFYYRFNGGESPADCYDRTSSFLDSLWRQINRKSSESVVIVTHGLTIRCFVMRFFHLTIEQFDELENPENCDLITIAPREECIGPIFQGSKWGVTGLKLRQE